MCGVGFLEPWWSRFLPRSSDAERRFSSDWGGGNNQLTTLVLELQRTLLKIDMRVSGFYIFKVTTLWYSSIASGVSYLLPRNPYTGDIMQTEHCVEKVLESSKRRHEICKKESLGVGSKSSHFITITLWEPLNKNH